MNYYIHCPRQCYLHAHKLNMKNNSEDVKIGKVLHEEKYKDDDNGEVAIDNIKLDKITKEYLIEAKKSDADAEASRWQLIYYLHVLKEKGMDGKGELEFIQKNKEKKVVVVELNEEIEAELFNKMKEIQKLIQNQKVPDIMERKHCEKMCLL